jgi:hypothetical protein
MYTFLIILLLLLPIPLYWAFKAMFKKEKDQKSSSAFKAALLHILKKHGLSISGVSVFSNKIIGLDHRNNKLIWIDYRNNDILEHCVLFRNIRFCTILKETDLLTGCTRKVVIRISFHNGDDPAYFTFYDESIDPVHELPARVRKANHWKNKIQLHLNSIKAGPVLEYVL